MTFILKSFAKDIFFEYKTHKEPSKAIILLPGFPSNNNQDKIINLLFEEGYNIFFMRYKGSFQSKGAFLEQDPSQEIKELLLQLETETTINLWDETGSKFKNTEYIILTGSFSGAISLGVDEEKIKKIILCSPVWDYTEHNKDNDEQELSHLTKFVKKAWNNLYNYDFKDVQEQMKNFENCKWKNYKDKIKGKKVLILHDQNDKTTSIKHTHKHIEEIPSIKLIEHNRGHGMNILLIKQYVSEIKQFIEGD